MDFQNMDKGQIALALGAGVLGYFIGNKYFSGKYGKFIGAAVGLGAGWFGYGFIKKKDSAIEE